MRTITANRENTIIIHQLLGAALKDREAHDLVHKYANIAQYGKQEQMVFDAISTYYTRDPAATSADIQIVGAIIDDSTRSEKHQTTLKSLLSSLSTTDVSVDNVKELLLQAHIKKVKDRLAVALVNADQSVQDELLTELSSLKSVKSLDQLSTGSKEEVYTTDNLDDLILKSYDISNMLKIYPTSIGDRIGGGVLPGQHIVIGAVPNLGKSGMVVTMVSGFAARGRHTLIVCNEEPPSVYWMRFIQAMSGKTKEYVLENYHECKALAQAKGLDNIIIVGVSPGTPHQVEPLIEKYHPDVLVVDQILHFQAGKHDSKTNSIEAAAVFMRNMASRHKLVAISITQCGDSAYGKQILQMNDLYMSNTAVQGTADIMILIGADEDQEARGYRTVNIVKNKVNGRHESFPVRLDMNLSRYMNA